MRAAKVLMTIPLCATIFVALGRATRHFALDWPVHAQHHLIHQIVMFVGIAVIGLMLVYGPLARRERWSWWALVIAAVAIHGGFWLGHPIVGMGEPATMPNVAQGILSALFVAGLFVARRALPADG